MKDFIDKVSLYLSERYLLWSPFFLCVSTSLLSVLYHWGELIHLTIDGNYWLIGWLIKEELHTPCYEGDRASMIDVWPAKLTQIDQPMGVPKGLWALIYRGYYTRFLMAWLALLLKVLLAPELCGEFSHHLRAWALLERSQPASWLCLASSVAKG